MTLANTIIREISSPLHFLIGIFVNPSRLKRLASIPNMPIHFTSLTKGRERVNNTGIDDLDPPIKFWSSSPYCFTKLKYKKG